MTVKRVRILLMLLAACAAFPAAAQRTRPTPSGLPVPRWVSLKFDKVYARAGPGEDHAAVKALWRPRSLGELDECRGAWCRVKVGSVGGWAPKRVLWGASE